MGNCCVYCHENVCLVVHKALDGRLCSGTGGVALARVHDSASQPGIWLLGLRICPSVDPNNAILGVKYTCRSQPTLGNCHTFSRRHDCTMLQSTRNHVPQGIFTSCLPFAAHKTTRQHQQISSTSIRQHNVFGFNLRPMSPCGFRSPTINCCAASLAHSILGDS
jgi:hypothetical protein